MFLGFQTQIERGRMRVLCQQNFEKLRSRGFDAEKFSIGRFFRLARNSERVIVPGGTHLQFLRGSAYLPQYRVLAGWMFLTLIARAARSRPQMVSVGVGPLETLPARIIAHATCRIQNCISVRDQASRRLLSGWRMRVPIVEDVALPYIRLWHGRSSHSSAEECSPYILAAPAFARCDVQWWADRIVNSFKATDVRRVVFFASGQQSGGSDSASVRAISSRLRTADMDPFNECTYIYSGDVDHALSVINGATAVIAARYHVVLASRALGKPVIPDVYHPKVIEAMEMEPLH
ncbi:polysaccharide pyruvyl transferase family protein [Mycolicibacterium sp. OfavD-34-C]|uniref:polysaccharide pyruvyl transferase family protein n=1 Tax=Mycolicibacterium sp. OfavD-34-C TaxID=2917746 RepID=UPI0035AB6E39